MYVGFVCLCVRRIRVMLIGGYSSSFWEVFVSYRYIRFLGGFIT